MLNPLLNIPREKHCPDGSIAFLELFKAVSNLNDQPTPKTDVAILDVENIDAAEIIDGDIAACANEGEGKLLHENGTGTTVADSEPSEIMLDDPVDDVDREKQRMRTILDRELQHARNNNGHIRIMEAFEEARSSPHELLDNDQLINIFHHVLNYDLPASYEVLKYYAARCKEEGRLVRLDMYQRVIHRVRPVKMHHDDSKHRPSARRLDAFEMTNLVKDITQHIQQEYSEGKKVVYQYILLPELVVALTEHSFPRTKGLATPIMEYILDNKFPVLDPDLYKYILSKGRRSETDSFPYHRVLSELISAGHTPNPEVVMNVLQCYHPFNDIDSTYEVLSIIQKLHLGDDDSASATDYKVDLGTLESISMASARLNVEVNLLVWDLVELFGYSPTGSMFEDVIMSFAATKQDENMYSALADMEKHGFVPSQALLRYVAVKVSYNENRLDHSQRMLTWRGNEHVRSTHGMNVLLIGYGMKRDLNTAFSVFEDFPKWELRPDASTFSFLMESLYIDTMDRFRQEAGQPLRQYKQDDIDDVIGAAQIILDAMKEAGVEKTKQFFHEHIKLFCVLGRPEDAKLVLEEAISSGTLVPMASLFKLATTFADNGDFENSYAVAGLSSAAGCGELPRLNSTINNLKKTQENILIAERPVSR